MRRGYLASALALSMYPGMFARPAVRLAYPEGYCPHDSHVMRYRDEQRRQIRLAQQAEAARLKRERDKPIIDAAEAKRARKADRRLSSTHTGAA